MKKKLSAALAVLLTVAMLPISAFAGTVDFNLSDSGCDYYNLIEQTDYALAPGATESEIVINDDTGSNRNVMHVIEVDLTNDNISVMPTYMGLEEGIDFEDSNTWGSQKLTEQAAHVENDLGLNVVGGINTNLRYDNDHPYGVLVWNGVVYSDERNSSGVSTAQTFLSMTKDGVASLHSASEPIPEDSYNAISANFGWIIKDGVSQYKTDDHADASRAPRTVIGIKDSGELILMMNDGRQAPFSAGMTMRELAEVLLAMGCVDAVNCDGGGSSTFISEREGTGELTMKSSPSDGGQRATLGGLLVVSKAVKDGRFDHATVKANSDSQYVTPGSTVKFTAVGADSAGGPADIPSDVTWQLENASMGTIEDGVFTSNGTVGEAVIQMVYDGEVVGEDSINVVIPEAIAFTQTNMTVPFGKTAELTMKATVNDGLNEVVLKDGDIKFALSDAKLGTIEGFNYSACDEEAGVSEGTIEAVLTHNTSVTATASLKLGKGSEVVWDFEDGDISALSFGTGYGNKHTAHKELGRFEKGYLEVVDSTTGQVKNGDKALAVVCDWSGFYAMGYNMLKLSGLGIDMTDAVGVGFWAYITPEATGVEFDLNNAIPFNSGDAGSDAYPEDGWYYIYAAKADGVGESFNNLSIYHTDGYDSASELDIPNIKTKHTIYIDDITVDYSTVVSDREAPEFTSVYIAEGDDKYTEMEGQTISKNTITVMAETKEDTTKDNYTGLDVNSAKVYVDGVQLEKGYACSSNGTITVDSLELSEGIHTFKFEIADNAGNYRSVTRQVVIDATEDTAKVEFVPQDTTLTKLPIGSIYWMDLKVSDIENIDSISAELNLDGMNDWQLDHMEVAAGFEAEYTIDEYTNDATLTITKTGKVEATGDAVLVSIPIHVWEYTVHTDHPECVKDGVGCEFVSTPATMWAGDGNCRVAILVSVDRGEVVFADDSTDTFSSENYVVDTELHTHRNLLTQTEKNSKTSWHIHTPVAVEDKEPTCTEAGYTGRTVCAGCSCGNTAENPCDTYDGCGSVVDWGTIIPATGHTYEVIDGQLMCECGEVYEGTGFATIDNKTYYVLNNALVTGWQYIGEDYYYFDTETYEMYTGVSTVENMEYTFDEEGKLVRGAFVTNSKGTRYYFAGKLVNRRWIELEEGTYWAESDGYLAYGPSPTLESSHGDYIWYDFDSETGLVIGRCDGFVEYKGDTYYCENGEVFYGAIGVDDYIIFTSTMGIVRKNAACSITAMKNCDIATGLYWCDEDGKILKDGFATIVGYDYYFTNYEKAKGFTKIGEDYYIFNTASGKMYKDATMWVGGSNEYGFEAGYYDFGEDGKLVLPETNVKKIIEDNGYLYFTIDGEIQKNGLNELDGEYYYAKSSGKLVVDTVAWVSQKNDLITDSNGWYAFDEEGKMIKTGFVTGTDGSTYYYEDAVRMKGFTKVGDDYYFLNAASGKMYKSATMWVGSNNEYGFAGGYYDFDEEGKMIVPDPDAKKKIIEVDGYLYFTVDDVVQKNGLNELNGEYYYAKSNGKLVVNTTAWVSQRNGLISDSNGWYAFDEEGKMIKTGLVTGTDGSTYYYEDAVRMKGFTKVGDDYYFLNVASGKMYKSATMWVGSNNGYGFAAGYYEFGSDGKMIK